MANTNNKSIIESSKMKSILWGKDNNSWKFYYRGNELIANIIIKDPNGKKPDTLLKLDGQELYDNIKLFDLKKLTGLDRIINMVPIIALFGKMLTNTILIKDYRALYFGKDSMLKDSNINKIENVIEYVSCITDCGDIALRGDINSLKNFIKAVVSYNFCTYRKDMVGVFNYTYLGNGEGLEEDLDGIKESKDRKFDTYVFPELEKELEFASDVTNLISETSIVKIQI